jgi:hypothetical protein
MGVTLITVSTCGLMFIIPANADRTDKPKTDKTIVIGFLI